MSAITLTDRIQVSVRAKNDSQASSQKRDTGRNIAKALGNDNISDSLADQIGATTKPTITDENGNEWISMEDIIAAGRKMKENGAFDDVSWDKYEGANYEFYIISRLTDLDRTPNSYHMSDSIYTGSIIVYIPSIYSGSNHYTLASVDSEGTIHRSYTLYWNDGTTVRTQTEDDASGYNIRTHSEIESDQYLSREPDIIINKSCRINAIRQAIALGVNPTEHHGGGSLIDWDAPNAEVERQIKELHESWDVSEHEGAVTANGTYVLAGSGSSHSGGDF